jgi:hypothetical protein
VLRPALDAPDLHAKQGRLMLADSADRPACRRLDLLRPRSARHRKTTGRRSRAAECLVLQAVPQLRACWHPADEMKYPEKKVRACA